MTQEQFWILLSKKLAGESTQEELKELENQILEHPEWQYAIQNLEDLWNHEPKKEYSKEEDAFMLHLHRMEELGVPFELGPTFEKAASRPGFFRMNWLKVAASIVVLAGSLLVYWNYSGNKQKVLATTPFQEIATRPGSKTNVQLPDGSTVVLNGGSKLTYNKDFGKETREVVLTGEGFFDVKKMNGIPFIIHTSSINIKVLGTAFNVKAYPEDKKTETSLIRGSIEVTIMNRPNDKIILSPSEKLVVENVLVEREMVKKASRVMELESPTVSTLMSVKKLSYSPVDSSVLETQWLENKLVFRDESFAEIAVRMERWYNVEIELTDEALSEKRYSGIFESETIEQALDALKETVPFQYEKEGNKFIIHR